ncbi:MAG: glycosyltransferase [Gemmatimonadales bacterium]
MDELPPDVELVIPPPARSIGSLWGRLNRRVSRVVPASVALAFPEERAIHVAAMQMSAEHPEAIHQFEGENLAAVMPFLQAPLTVYSAHDLLTAATLLSISLKSGPDRSRWSPGYHRDIRFAEKLEARIISASKAVLCISSSECDTLRDTGCRAARYLPLGITDPGTLSRSGFLQDGTIRLLHLGRPAHSPSYRALRTLLAEVFPRLPPEVLNRIHLDIVGHLDDDSPLVADIQQLAAPFAERVRFCGFVPDLRPHFATSDLLVVLNDEGTGTRTRIVEAAANGLPVLTSTNNIAAFGVQAKDVVLLADDPVRAGQLLMDMLNDPGQLASLARASRAWYEQQHSHPAVSRLLHEVLVETGIRTPEAKPPRA